jgi:hypothetical protein
MATKTQGEVKTRVKDPVSVYLFITKGNENIQRRSQKVKDKRKNL